jgi:hypothetical protein
MFSIGDDKDGASSSIHGSIEFSLKSPATMDARSTTTSEGINEEGEEGDERVYGLIVLR